MPIFNPINASQIPLAIRKAGATVGTRSRLNFEEGVNLGIDVVDNAAQNRIDVTLSNVVTDYRSSILALGPKSYWKLDETTGTVAADVNSLVNGTYVGSVTKGTAALVNSDTGKSVSVTGNGQDVNLGTTSYAFAGTLPWSWIIWANISAQTGASNGQVLISRFWFSGTLQNGITIGCWFDTTPPYLIFAERWVSGVKVAAATGSIYSLGDRHMIGASFGELGLTLFVDGAQVAQVADSRSMPVGTATLMLGNRGDNINNGKYTNGLIDEAAVWDRALSASDMATAFSAGL